jgi:hypothetical protein
VLTKPRKEILMNAYVGRLAEFALVMAGLSFYAASVMNLLATFDHAHVLTLIS